MQNSDFFLKRSLHHMAETCVLLQLRWIPFFWFKTGLCVILQKLQQLRYVASRWPRMLRSLSRGRLLSGYVLQKLYPLGTYNCIYIRYDAPFRGGGNNQPTKQTKQKIDSQLRIKSLNFLKHFVTMLSCIHVFIWHRFFNRCTQASLSYQICANNLINKILKHR